MTELQHERMKVKLDRIRPILVEHLPNEASAFDSLVQSIQFAPPEVHLHVLRFCEWLAEKLGPIESAPHWARAIHDIWMSPNPPEGR